MPQSSSTTTCLRGVYNPESPSKYKQHQILRYNKPLTDDLRNSLVLKNLGLDIITIQPTRS